MNRRAWLLLGSLFFLLVGSALLGRPSLPVDETRYLAVAWEMWVRGEFLVPLLNGTPYSHKPPLLFWLIHSGWSLFGVNEWWPRLLPALCALVALAQTARLARRLWPERGGTDLLAVWLLFGTLAWAIYTTALLFDMLLGVFVLLGLLGLERAAQEPDRLRGWSMLGAAVAFGLLAKGPVILLHLFPPAILVRWWRPPVEGQDKVWCRRWYRSLALAMGGGVGLALLWALPAAWHGGEPYARELLWKQTEGRLIHSFAHGRPVFWYLWWLPLLWFPWLLWLPIWRALVAAWRGGFAHSEAGPPPDAGLRLLFAWLLPAFGGLSLISGKQFHYLLPLLPGLSLLTARGLAQDGSALNDVPPRSSAFWPAGAWGMIAIAMGVFAWHSPPLWPGHEQIFRMASFLVGGSAAAIALGLYLGLWRSRTNLRRGTVLLAISSPLFLALAQWVVVPQIVPYYDLRPAALRLAQFERAGRPIAYLGKYHGEFHFAGRLQRPLAILNDAQSVSKWFERHPDGVLVRYVKAKRPHGQSDISLPLVFSQRYRGGVLEIRARTPPSETNMPASAQGQASSREGHSLWRCGTAPLIGCARKRIGLALCSQ